HETLLTTLWENHNPTQGMRQGDDIGTQYRSGIYTYNVAQRQAAEASKAMYERELKNKRYGSITTEIVDAPEFYFAEDYHQQYLAKNPFGYCGLGGTGVSCPIGTGAKLTQGAPASQRKCAGPRASGDQFVFGARVPPTADYFFMCFARNSCVRFQARSPASLR